MSQEADFTIIGSGTIGDKAEQLLQKTPALREMGFSIPHRTVLAEGFLDEFFRHNNLGSSLRDVKPRKKLEDAIRNGSLTTQQQYELRSIVEHYAVPLAIRSSAAGDSRGTGTYKSAFSNPELQQASHGLQEVLASYFSPSAIRFRADAKTGEGFAIMIEPLIGQQFGDRGRISPVVSGFGYTSTSRGEGYLNVVPGLGGGVESRNGEHITQEAIREFDGSLIDYIRHQWNEHLSKMDLAIQPSALLGIDSSCHITYDMDAFRPNARHSEKISRESTELEEYMPLLRPLILTDVFSRFQEMEQVFGKPQYFEWAATTEGKLARYWITQIADVDKKLDTFDFAEIGQILLSGHNVIGSGIKKCRKIVECREAHELGQLHDFNKQNDDYILLYSSGLTTSVSFGKQRLAYEDFSNAAVILEIPDAQHTGNLQSHFGGQLDMTSKFFAVLNRECDWELFETKSQKEHGLPTYQGNVKVIASERQNKLIVSEMD